MFINKFKFRESHWQMKRARKGIFSFFFRLKRLVLRATSLNDDLISKLTLPYRIYKERVSMIEELDISGKRIL